METGKNYAQISNADAFNMFVIGQVTTEMPIGITYGIRIGGLQNPRFIVQNSNLPAGTRQDFIVTTYDSLGTDDKVNLIDKGTGGAIDIDKVS